MIDDDKHHYVQVECRFVGCALSLEGLKLVVCLCIQRTCTLMQVKRSRVEVESSLMLAGRALFPRGNKVEPKALQFLTSWQSVPKLHLVDLLRTSAW